MEPMPDAPSPYYINHPANNSNQTSPYGSYNSGSNIQQGPRISEIMSRADGAQRKLPVPKVREVAVQDYLGTGVGFRDGGSGRSSKEGSVVGGEY